MGLELVQSSSTEHIILLERGNIAPTVTTLQILMRCLPPHSMIGCDGIFGYNTYNAVAKFQGQHGCSVDGTVGNETWGKLSGMSRLKIIDVVDGTDPALVQLEANDIRHAGGDPIIIYGMSNGVDYAMTQIALRAGGPGTTALLRFHGHGKPGTQNMSAGTIDGAPHMAGISNENFPMVMMSLMKIRHIFVSYGSVQLLGCNVGSGAPGQSLVQKLADTWGVPVSAGVYTQLGGGRATFQFEGPTVTGFPAGMDLRTWSLLQQNTAGNQTIAPATTTASAPALSGLARTVRRRF